MADTGPLSHFAKAGWLSVLKFLAPNHELTIPDVVADELRRGAGHHPHLRIVLQAPWIKTVELSSREEIAAFSRYAQRLTGASQRNVGECGVLALAEVHAMTALVDDREAVKAAQQVPATPVPVLRTLRLLCDAINQQQITRDMASAVCDDLIRSDYHVQVPVGGFIPWADDHGLLT